MKIAVASDHRGVRIRRRVMEHLRKQQHEVVDLGADSEDSVDYPDFAAKAATMVAAGQADRAILVCGTGLGMAIAANKVAGIRATPVHDDVTAELSRSHNDSNVLCLAADLLGDRLIEHVVDIWVRTPFEGGRHARRVQKISDIEKSNRQG